MSNEQHDNDTLVSAAYRDAAQESTPPNLDEAVLRMAARSKTASFGERISTWVTPLTWTVTAGLCVVLVMNVPDLDNSTEVLAPASPAESIEEAFAAEDANVVEEAEKMAGVRDGQDQPAALGRARQQQSKRLEEVQADVAVENLQPPSSAAFSSDAVARTVELEKKEKEMAHEPSCAEASRAQPESWYQCVLELRDQGRTGDADREILELVEQFPDFRPE